VPPPPPVRKEEPKPEPKEEPKPKPKPVEPAKVEKPKEEKKPEKPKPEPKEETKPVERTKVAKLKTPVPDIPDNPLDDVSPLDEMSPLDDVVRSASARPTRQPVQTARGVQTGKAGISMAGGIPSALGAWGGNVQRKVENEWKIPEAIQLGPVDDGAIISFWVSRAGQLLGDPKVERHAVDAEVAASAIRAIRSAVPYPPFPEGYGDAEVQVFYTFIPTR